MNAWRVIVIMAGLISTALAVTAAASCGTHDLIFHPDHPDAGSCEDGGGGAGGAGGSGGGCP